MRDEFDALVFGCFIVFFCILGSCGGFGAGAKHERENAVKAGVGEYIADPKTGHVKFVYKSSGGK